MKKILHNIGLIYVNIQSSLLVQLPNIDNVSSIIVSKSHNLGIYLKEVCMDVFETILISIGLAMDAFTVSICKGLSMKKMEWKKAFIIGGYFGFFQMLMPSIGYALGVGFSDWVESVDHWIAFILLGIIGIKMIRDSFSKEEKVNDNVNIKTMFVLAIATSIDALAIGITYAFLDTSNSFVSFVIIGIITFLISTLGVKIGNRFGNKFGDKAEIFGGLILIFLGIKILLEHTIFK